MHHFSRGKETLATTNGNKIVAKREVNFRSSVVYLVEVTFVPWKMNHRVWILVRVGLDFQLDFKLDFELESYKIENIYIKLNIMLKI